MRDREVADDSDKNQSSQKLTIEEETSFSQEQFIDLEC